MRNLEGKKACIFIFLKSYGLLNGVGGNLGREVLYVLLLFWFRIVFLSWDGSRVHKEALSSTRMPMSEELKSWFANCRTGYKGYSLKATI